jgi:hypothetical protein
VKSSQIVQTTTFKLHCDGFWGSNPPSVDQSIVVHLIPNFREPNSTTN